MNVDRVATPDLLKGIAVVFMIQVHLMELFALPDLFGSRVGRLSLFLGGPPAAPVFMLVMGYFAFGKMKNFLVTIKRGLKIFMWGMLLNIGINIHLFVKIALGKVDVNPFDFLFGVDIFHLAGISLIIIALLRKVLKNNWLAYLFLSLLVAATAPFLPKLFSDGSAGSYFNAYLWGYYNSSYFPLFPWLAYPLAGGAFRLFYEKYNQQLLKNNRLLFILIPLFVFGIFSIEYAVDIAANLKVYYHHGIEYFAWCLAFAAFLAIVVRIAAGEFRNRWLTNYFIWLGQNVTSLYVFQWLLIGNIATALYRTQGIVEIFIWFPTILIISSLFAYYWIIAKTKIFAGSKKNS